MLIMHLSGLPSMTPHYAVHHSVCAVHMNTVLHQCQGVVLLMLSR